MSGIRLSHSSKDLYLLCPLKWKLHYIKKYRSIRTSSALVLGTAIDEALNNLLLTRDYDSSEAIFKTLWVAHEHVNNIDYYPQDLDSSILPLDIIEAIESIVDYDERKHCLAWNVLNVKGPILLRAYYDKILPRIKRVISVQEPIKLTGTQEDGTESKDSITGIVDAVVEMELDDGTIGTVILDNKTSSVPYPKNALSTKEQTALYSIAMPHIEYAGFAIVVKKDLGRTQILIGKPPEELKQKTLDNFVEVLHNINCGNFEPNRKACNSFGMKCQYYSYCQGEGFSKDIYEKTDDKK